MRTVLCTPPSRLTGILHYPDHPSIGPFERGCKKPGDNELLGSGEYVVVFYFLDLLPKLQDPFREYVVLLVTLVAYYPHTLLIRLINVTRWDTGIPNHPSWDV